MLLTSIFKQFGLQKSRALFIEIDLNSIKKTGSNYRTVLEIHFGFVFTGLIRFTGSA